tara:strand:- start:478 stop:975 length:498 start_codon:yes stop_codon:yes gene_type:complete
MSNDKHLYYLHELSDYKVASDDPDVRGWTLKDKNDRKVGTIDNLLVNKNTEKVVYLDVEVDKTVIEANHKPYSHSAKDGVHEFLNKDGENHLIVPIGMVTLNDDSKEVRTTEITHDTFAETKRVSKNAPLNRDYEIVVLESYNRNNETYPENDEFYQRNEFKREK